MFLENIMEHLATVTLSNEEYHQALREAALTGVAGGTLYDLLIATCACVANAEVLYTWNTRHYELFGPRVTELIRVPQ